MSDTVETDISRVWIIANEILPHYNIAPLSFEQLRRVADGPFDLFLIPLIFPKECALEPLFPFNEAKRAEVRRRALEVARRHGFDVNPPDFIPGIEQSLRETKAAGMRNVLMTTGGRRFKHQAMEKAGLGGYFDEIVDREQTYYVKEQGLYYLYRKSKSARLRLILLTGTATYIQAGNNVDGCKVGDTELEVVTVALATEHSYNDEETLKAARPKILIHRHEQLLPSLDDLKSQAA
jgi:phosphoglycolate phosphatase-like HAD superfamily hydrolase